MEHLLQLVTRICKSKALDLIELALRWSKERKLSLPTENVGKGEGHLRCGGEVDRVPLYWLLYF